MSETKQTKATPTGFRAMLASASGEPNQEKEYTHPQPQAIISPFVRMLEAAEFGGSQNFSAYINHQPSTPEPHQQTSQTDPTTFIRLYERMIRRVERALNNQKSEGLLSTKFVEDSHIIHNFPSIETSKISSLEDGESLITLQGFDRIKITRKGNRLVTSFADL